jgi:hypothetical protein
MNELQLKELLDQVAAGSCDTENALDRLRHMPVEDLGFARWTITARFGTACPRWFSAAAKRSMR